MQDTRGEKVPKDFDAAIIGGGGGGGAGGGGGGAGISTGLIVSHCVVSPLRRLMACKRVKFLC